MNSLPSDLDYNIGAGKGTAGSLAILASTCFMEIADFFPKKKLAPFFEFGGPRPGLKKDPLFPEIGNDHAYHLAYGELQDRGCGAVTHRYVEHPYTILQSPILRLLT